MRSLVNSSSTVIAAALNCELGSVNGSTRRLSPVLTRSSLRCTPFSATVPRSTSGCGRVKSTRSPSSAYGTNAASASLTNAAFVNARSWLGQFATRSIAMAHVVARATTARKCEAVRRFKGRPRQRASMGASSFGALRAHALARISPSVSTNRSNPPRPSRDSIAFERYLRSFHVRIKRQVAFDCRAKPVARARRRHRHSAFDPAMAPTMLSANVHAASVATRSSLNGNAAVSARYARVPGASARSASIASVVSRATKRAIPTTVLRRLPFARAIPPRV